MEECSFCGNALDQGDTQRLVRSPLHKNIYICDSCNRMISSIISNEDDEGLKKKMRGKVHPPKMHKALENDGMVEICTLKPREIHQELNRIIGQEKAKKALAVAVYNHAKRLSDKNCLIKKSNILLVGPSGSGKTLLAETISNVLNVPFATLDASSISPPGFVGNDPEICLQELLAKARGNVRLAEQGVIFIDEIDKLSRSNESVNHSKGGSSINTQAALLKIIEGSKISLPAIGKNNGASSSLITINTENILFICGGAFCGIDDCKQNNPMGFHTSNKTPKEKSSTIDHESVIKYGLMPELVGRLPVLITLDELQEDDLVRILTEPEDSIIKEYQLLFEKDGINLLFEDDALHEIAKKAYANKTGARGLRTILEDILLDIMFDIPSMENISECIITKETLTTKIPVLIESKVASELCSNGA